MTGQTTSDHADAARKPLLGSKYSHISLRSTRAGEWLEKLRSSNGFVLFTVCLALFTDAFIYGVVVPVMPFVLRDRPDVADDDEQKYTSNMLAVFGAAILAGSPIVGFFADRIVSRRLPLILGFLLLGGSIALFGKAPSVALLLFARVLQGASTAITWTMGLALLVDSVGKDQVGVSMGTALSSNSFAMVISPLIGGVVFDRAGIVGVLAVMGGLVVLALVCLLFMKGTSKKRSRHAAVINSPIPAPVDNPQIARLRRDSGISYGAISSRSPSRLRDQLQAESSLRPRASIVSFPPMISVDPLPADEPTLPPMIYLLRSPRILTALYGVLMQFGILASFDATLPIFVQRTFGWAPLGAGVIFLAVALPALVGPLVGRLSDAVGPRRMALAGCLLTTPPLLLLRLVNHAATTQTILLCALLVWVGLANTLIISPLAADLSFAVDEMEAHRPGIFGEAGAYGQAYALFNCAMAAAVLAGPLLAGGVQAKYGWQGVSVLLGVWCATAILPVLLFVGDGVKVVQLDDGEGNEENDVESIRAGRIPVRRVSIEPLVYHALHAERAESHDRRNRWVDTNN